MLLLLRETPEVHDRLLFGTDYPLSVFDLPAWGRIGLSDLFDIQNTNNRFDKQYLVCEKLGLKFGSFGKFVKGRTKIFEY